jgi:hypothetical protein
MKTKEIKKLVENHFNINLSIKSRERTLVHSRFLYYHLAYNYSSDGYSLAKIGKTLGGFDHATVLYGIKKYKDLYEFDKRFRQMVNPVIEIVNSQLDGDIKNNSRNLKQQVQLLKDKIIIIEKQLEQLV